MRALRWCGRALVRVVIAIYAAAILGFVFATRDLTFATIAKDPVFACYSLAVMFYVLGRFAMSLLYRPARSSGAP